jgi:hypothetical protein
MSLTGRAENCRLAASAAKSRELANRNRPERRKEIESLPLLKP